MHDVLIVGCGPVGAILANLLGKDGIDVLIVEEASSLYDKPRAINIDQEVLRICQSFGLAEDVQEHTVAHTGTDFLGAENQLIRVLNSLQPPYPLGWPPNLMFLQPRMEAVLRKGLARYPSVDFRPGHKLVDFIDTGDRITAQIKRVADGEVQPVEARYLIACDGGSSGVRKRLGISQTSLNFDESYIVVDALVKEGARVPRRTTHFCRPTGPGSYVVGPADLRRFEMKILPHEDPASFTDVDNVRAKLANFVDIDCVDIWRSAPYRFHALVADLWRSGRVVLAGDSAHQMPPHLGQGLCSGIRDVANLSWKLKLVLAGICDEVLLDSYQAERRPHINALVAISRDIAAVTGELDPQKASERDRKLIAEMESGRMITVRQKMIPGLAAGIVDPSGSLPAGELSVQPRIDVGRGKSVLLDDLLGETFTVLGADVDPRTQLTAEIVAALERIGTRFAAICSTTSSEPGHLAEDGILFRDWMSENGASLVIVRPDKYVYGTARDAASSERLARSLALALLPGVEALERPPVRNRYQRIHPVPQ